MDVGIAERQAGAQSLYVFPAAPQPDGTACDRQRGDNAEGSIDNYLRRAEVAGLGWPLPDDLSDTALYDKLFPPAAAPE